MNYLKKELNSAEVEEKVKMVDRLLLATGGKFVNQIGFKEADAILQRGFLSHSEVKVIKDVGFKKSDERTARIYRNAPVQYDLYVGFYLARDCVWYQGSWCVDKVSRKIVDIEKNKKYFGFLLNREEIEDFITLTEQGGK